MNPIGSNKLSARRTWQATAVAAAIIWALCATHPADAQGVLSGVVGKGHDGAGSQTKTIAVGTSNSVRNNETIDVQKSDGREFSGAVYQDVLDEHGDVAIPKGSFAELIVKDNSDEYLALDVESVEVHGLRYTVTTIAGRTDGEPPSGLKANARTGNFVDGAKFVRAITQIVTRGKAKVRAASFLTFRLKQPLAMGVGDDDLTRQGHH